jgi:hypothetical protein
LCSNAEKSANSRDCASHPKSIFPRVRLHGVQFT